MLIDPRDLDPVEAYKLLISIIVPRPIALVSTCNGDGIANLAPFSFFNGVSSYPPVISLAIGFRAGGQPKDTLVNIKATGQFVVNMVTETIGAAMHQASADYPHGISEFEQVGLTPLPSLKVTPPRVAESPINLECTLLSTIPVPEATTELVLGRIVQYHVADPMISDLTVDIENYGVIGRLGGRAYCTIGSTFTMPRADVPLEILEAARRAAP